MPYFYVQEDNVPSRRGFRWLARRVSTFSVYEADVDTGTGTFGPAVMVCSGLGRDQLRWFYSFPEVREELIAQWQWMRDHNTWKADPKSNARLVLRVKEARLRHGSEQDPRPLYTRSELTALLDRSVGP